MEQVVDMMIVGCMALICAFGLQDGALSAAPIATQGNVQPLEHAVPANVFGLSPLALAVVPTDIADAIAARLISEDAESVGKTTFNTLGRSSSLEGAADRAVTPN